MILKNVCFEAMYSFRVEKNLVPSIDFQQSIIVPCFLLAFDPSCPGWTWAIFIYLFVTVK